MTTTPSDQIVVASADDSLSLLPHFVQDNKTTPTIASRLMSMRRTATLSLSSSLFPLLPAQTTAASPTKLAALLSPNKELFPKSSKNRNKTTERPSLIWTPPRDSPQQLQHGSAVLFHADMVTIAAVQIAEMTPGFHMGTADSELHCDHCDALPHGVGLAVSMSFGVFFFLAYLLIVTVVWKKCPHISKPPDARLIALEKARRPNIKNRLFMVAKQAAGGLGVPLPAQKPAFTVLDDAEATATDIISYWARIATERNTGSTVMSGGNGPSRPFGSLQITIPTTTIAEEPASSSSQRAAATVTTQPFPINYDVQDEVLVAAALLPRSGSSTSDGGEREISLKQGPEKALSDNCINQVATPVPLWHLQTQPLDAQGYLMMTRSQSSSKIHHHQQQIKRSTTTTESSSNYDSACFEPGSGHRTRPFQVCSPLPMITGTNSTPSQKGRKYTKRRNAKLTRQRSLNNGSPPFGTKVEGGSTNDIRETIVSGEALMPLLKQPEITLLRSITVPRYHQSTMVETMTVEVSKNERKTNTLQNSSSFTTVPTSPIQRLAKKCLFKTPKLTTEESGVFMMETLRRESGDSSTTSSSFSAGSDIWVSKFKANGDFAGTPRRQELHLSAQQQQQLQPKVTSLINEATTLHHLQLCQQHQTMSPDGQLLLKLHQPPEKQPVSNKIVKLISTRDFYSNSKFLFMKE